MHSNLKTKDHGRAWAGSPEQQSNAVGGISTMDNFKIMQRIVQYGVLEHHHTLPDKLFN